MNRQSFKKVLIILHDMVMTAAAVVLTFVVRFEGPLFDARIVHLPKFLPFFVVFAGFVYWFFALYQSKWRFASLPDLANIARAATVLALTLVVVDYVLISPQFFDVYFFGKIAIALYWLLQMFLLGAPRLVYRYLKDNRTRKKAAQDAVTPTLLLGRGTDVEMIIRSIEAGTIRKLDPKGILSPRRADHGESIRGVPVLGGFGDLERVAADFVQRGTPLRRLVAAPSALAPESHPDPLIAAARRLGLPISRLTNPGEGVRDAEIAPLEIEDLLLRPTVRIDRKRLEAFLKGKRVAVTGGGGSIGSEICARVAAFGASDLLILENSEPALYRILESPVLAASEIRVEGMIADVRDRERIASVLRDFSPDVVFHAAALKHVPYLEQDWGEGIRTNVFGSVNVADAAVACGARALVNISTDKAIDPVSILGVTKRFAELYAQCLDAQLAGDPSATRLTSVRFGNVLGSVGSVVPKFKAQIARGGPVTITHPDMVRYFMTVQEASDLVLTAGSHADGEARQAIRERTADERASVYVLQMGQPLRIYDLAERVIRLAGFEPNQDIEIKVTGVRPGERLHEILFARDEPMAKTGIEGVMAARPVFADRARVETWLTALEGAVRAADRAAADAVFEEAIPEFKRRTQNAAPKPPAPAASRPAEPSLS